MNIVAKPLKLIASVFLLLSLHSQQAFSSTCNANERRALVSFGKSLSNFLPSPWLSDSVDCCKWPGVRCSNKTTTNHVTSITVALPNPEIAKILSLRGTINRSLAELSQLEHLDLSSNPLDKIPPFLGSLHELRYLDLSDANVSGTIPDELGSLLRLQYLNLSGNGYANVRSLKWLSNLSSLEYLDLSKLNLSKAHDWLQIMVGLPKLRTLRLSGCNLPDPPIVSPLIINSKSVLERLELQGNKVTDSIFPWLFKHSRTLSFVVVSNNQLKGLTPEALGTDMKLLQVLDLSHNQLEGKIPKSLGSLCGLRELYLMGNQISGGMEMLIKTLSKCSQSSSPTEHFFPMLKALDLSDNLLGGTIPEVIGNFSELVTLQVGGNFLGGVISEAHFSKLAKLKNLNLSLSSLVLNLRDNWIPPFQLENIRLSSLRLGPRFPEWIQTQTNYSNLDLSNASISGSIPIWLWNGLTSKSCQINLSKNQLTGQLQNKSVSFSSSPEINLSSNQLEGPIPSFLAHVTSLDLSNNKFSGTIDFLCSGAATFYPALTAVDLSNNHLSGELPRCWSRFFSLLILDLSNNNFSGNIPSEIGSLYMIKALQLRNNFFSGNLPKSLSGCQNLEVLDLGGNRLSGPIPKWIGSSLHDLIVLSLRSNQFSGGIASQLCNLTGTQLLDLSGNNISGEIPKCLGNLTALTVRGDNGYSNATIRIYYTSGVGSINSYDSMFEAEVQVNWRGNMYEYKREMNLGYMKCVDFSSNALSGQIPDEITRLRGLVSLNLSWNGLKGQIPHEIGALEELNVLDLSGNRLSGKIPSSLTQAYRLGTLNLSGNALSGRIPTGNQLQRFPVSAYDNNLGLCGPPLEDCHGGEERAVAGDNSGEDRAVAGDHSGDTSGQGFYVSMVVGYIVGLWVVSMTLVVNKCMRVKFFTALTTVYDWLYVKIAVACRIA